MAHSGIDSIRGTLILCDYLQPMNGGKWLIAGTHNTVMAPPGMPVLEVRGWLYLRLQVEHARSYQAKITLVDRNAPGNSAPLFDLDATLMIQNPLDPFEMGLPLPPLNFPRPPSPPDAPSEHQANIKLHLRLNVDGIDVASTPLSLVFFSGPPPH